MCEIVQGNPFGKFTNTLWKQMDKLLTREELALLIHPIYSEPRRYLPMVLILVQQGLHVLRERNILRFESRKYVASHKNIANLGSKRVP